MDASPPLLDLLSQVPDPRRAGGKRHPLPVVLSLLGVRPANPTLDSPGGPRYLARSARGRLTARSQGASGRPRPGGSTLGRLSQLGQPPTIAAASRNACQRSGSSSSIRLAG